MIERITKNEERLDTIISAVRDLDKSLEEFQKIQKDLSLLNRYYGSKNWFSDKEKLENGSISNIKAGVLSEDSVWNINEEIKELMAEMSIVINHYEHSNRG